MCFAERPQGCGGYEPLTLDRMCAYQNLQTATSKAGISDWANTEIEGLPHNAVTIGREPFLHALDAEIRKHQADGSQ